MAKNQVTMLPPGNKPAPGMPKKHRVSGASLDAKKAWSGYLFLAPFIIGLLFIYGPVIIDSIKFSFAEVKTLQGGGFRLIPVGWANYNEALFVDPDFTRELITGIKDLLFDVPAIVIFSLFMAVLLNQKMRGRAIFRAIFFIPVIVSTGIIESIDIRNTIITNQEQLSGAEDSMDGANTGAQILSVMDINRLFGGMQIGGGIVTYVVGLINDVYDIVNKSGVQMLIFLAGLQSISPAIYESCHIDGASAWETFWKITFPMISPMILVNAVYTVIDSFTSQSNTIMKYIDDVYDQTNGTVIATAMSWIYFLIVILALALVAGVLSAYVFYQRKDV